MSSLGIVPLFLALLVVGHGRWPFAPAVPLAGGVRGLRSDAARAAAVARPGIERHETETRRFGHRLEPRVRPELAQDVLNVRAKRGGRNAEGLRGRLAGSAAREEPQDLELARGEWLDLLSCRVAVEEEPLQLVRREEDLAGRRRADAGDDGLQVTFLREMTDGTGAGDVRQRLRTRIRGEDDDGRLGRLKPELSGDVRAGRVRQVIVGEDDLRMG